jgi:hypothetical protein
MKADVFIQQNKQSQSTGSIAREWLYETTIPCKIEPIQATSGGGRYDNKSFDIGNAKEYDEKLQLKMKCLIPISKRWRISNIRSNDGSKIFTEIDKYDNPDTIFDITASHPVLDPFGKITYYEVILQRAHVQNDNTESK